MSLDLGALVGHVRLDATMFERTYVRVVRQMAQLGVQADRSAVGVTTLDDSLSASAAAGNASATGLGNAARAYTEAGLSASEAAAATGALSDVTTQAGLAESRLTQAMLRQTAAQERYNALTASGSATTRQLAAAQASLVAANDRVTLSQERLGNATGVTSNAWQSAGRKMLVAGGVVALGLGLAAHAAADFDAEMANLNSLLPHAERERLPALRDAALSVGQAYGYTATAVADAETELVKAGVSVTDILGGALTGALTLAAAGQEDVADATSTAAVAMTQFHESGKDVPHIADLLAAGADKALGSVHDLSEALNYGGLAAAQAGYSIEETIGALAEFAQSGQIGSTAGAGLAMMLRNLQKPTGPAAETMKDLGIQVYDAQGNMLSLSAIAGELHDKIGTLPPAQRDAALATIFTSRAVRDANILMRDGAEASQAWVDKVNDQGFAAQQAAGKLDSLTGDVAKLKAALQTAFIGAGESGQGPLRTLVQDVTGLVTAYNSLPGPAQSVATALVLVGGAVALVAGGTLVLIPRIQATRVALAELGTTASGVALSGLTRVAGFMSGPWGLAMIAGVSAVETWGRAHADATKHVQGMTSAVQADSGAIGENTRAYVANVVATETVSGGHLTMAEAARKSGIEVSTLTDAILGDADAQKQLNDAADRGNIGAALLREKVKTLAGETKKATTAAKDQKTALGESGAAANSAADEMADLGRETKNATDRAKDYSDQLHAMADPLFAMNSALADLRGKQHALNVAIREHGADSHAAHQAQLALASSSLDVATASRTLTASVKDGTTSLHDARQQLHAWVQAGLITQSQARAVADAFGGLIDKAHGVTKSLREAGAGARTAGRRLGVDFGQGVVEGLDSKDGEVRAHAHLLASQLEKYARLATESNSPSKVAMRIGADFGTGMADGIKGSHREVAQAAADMATKAVEAAKQAVQDARADLHGDVQSRRQEASGITSGLMGGLDLSGAVVNGRVGNLSAYLRKGTRPLKMLAHDEALLRKRGLDPALLEQIAQVAQNSPTDALALTHNILSGKSGSIRHLDALERHARAYAKATGQSVAGSRFDRRIAEDRADLHDAAATLRRLEHILGSLDRHARRNPTEVGAAISAAFDGAHHKHTARHHR